jgi:hypothetical protein
LWHSRRKSCDRLSKNRASSRDPALHGFCKYSHIHEYAALSKTPRALADGLMLVLQQPGVFFLSLGTRNGVLMDS